ncbi:MAG: VanZ family protein [Geminicoccaceae bacterium]|nr:VanZ family protein [Geminicoccaceae bacterium]
MTSARSRAGHRPAADAPLARSLGLWIALLLVLASATVAVHRAWPRVQPQGPGQLLWPVASELPGAVESWAVEPDRGRAKAEGGALVLEAPPSDPHAMTRRALDQAPDALGWRLEAEVRFIGRAGAKPYEAARIHLLGRDAAGRRLPDQRLDLWQARADRAWETVRADLAPPIGAATTEVVVRLQGTAGRLELRRLEARPLLVHPWLLPVRVLLALGWFAALAWGARLLWRVAERRLGATVALAASALALASILAPPWMFEALPGLLARPLERASSLPFLPHAILAATVAYLAGRAVGTTRPARGVPLVLLLAVSGEVLQMLTVGRTPSLDDAVANAAGGIAGLWLAWLLPRLATPRGRGTEKSVAIESALPLVPMAGAGGKPPSSGH